MVKTSSVSTDYFSLSYKYFVTLGTNKIEKINMPIISRKSAPVK